MEHRHPALLKISFNTSICFLLVGWLAFLIWLFARKHYAVHLAPLDSLIKMWVFVSFGLAAILIALISVYTYYNQHFMHLKILLTMLLSFAIIPSMFIIGFSKRALKETVFVKLENHSGLDFSSIILLGNWSTDSLKPLEIEAAKVMQYIPTYLEEYGNIYQVPDELDLILNSDSNIDTIQFPYLTLGSCVHLEIDKNLKIRPVIKNKF